VHPFWTAYYTTIGITTGLLAIAVAVLVVFTLAEWAYRGYTKLTARVRSKGEKKV
jgi:hypothetical protein